MADSHFPTYTSLLLSLSCLSGIAGWGCAIVLFCFLGDLSAVAQAGLGLVLLVLSILSSWDHRQVPLRLLFMSCFNSCYQVINLPS